VLDERGELKPAPDDLALADEGHLDPENKR
jgi:hypothetical protein